MGSILPPHIISGSAHTVHVFVTAGHICYIFKCCCLLCENPVRLCMFYLSANSVYRGVPLCLIVECALTNSQVHAPHVFCVQVMEISDIY